MSELRSLRNGRTKLALHERKGGAGTGLLLLHALHGSSADWGSEVDDWPGPVHALDFCGHGDSGWLLGGAYGIECYLSDADLALRSLGSAALVGSGLGAWIGVVLAGTRVERVPACLLVPGAGLAGCGSEPDPRDVQPSFPTPGEMAAFRGGGDPFGLAMERDPRPPWFSQPFAQAARRVLRVADGGPEPEWWAALPGAGAVPAGTDLASGLAALARALAEPGDA